MSGTEGPISPTPPARVLLAEDDPTLASALATELRARGFDVLPAADGHLAMSLARGERFDAAVVEMMLPGASGFQVVREVRVVHGPFIPLVMMSDVTALEHRQYADLLGVDRFLVKPLLPAELAAAVQGLLSTIPRLTS